MWEAGYEALKVTALVYAGDCDGWKAVNCAADTAEKRKMMKITNLKINGVTNPVGFSYDKVLCSWKTIDTKAKLQKDAKIEVSLTEDFSSVMYSTSGSRLNSNEAEILPDLKPYTTYYWRVAVWGDNGDAAVSAPAAFETAKMKEPWKAEWIGPAKGDTFHPVLHKTFSLGGKTIEADIPKDSKSLLRARLYICGLGVYEAYINGNIAGNDLLAPFLNDYRECLQYQTYDVTDQIQEKNEIAVYLGKGWYLGTFGLEGKEKNFGDCMAVIAELRLEYEDGSVETVSTDESWQYQGSDIRDSGIYFGEILDRTLWKDRENPLKPVEKAEISTKLVERYSIPVIVKEELVPVEVLHTPAGETVLDMGQNFAGIMEFYADFEAGTKITIECGEILQQGDFYHDNYREAESKFVYVSDGRSETVRPHFTYYGFRYLKVTGWPGELKKEDIIGKVVYSDLERIGFMETSNDKINRLYQNCLWGQKSNFLDIPTDCPQRNERLGWTGDAQVFTPTACYNMDTRAFFRKFFRDLRSEQLRLNGGVPNFIPNLEAFGGACSVWGDVAAFGPAAVYEKYGNLSDIEACYPMMKDWVDYMTREDEKNGSIHMFRPQFQFGDWLALDGITPQSFKGGTDDHYIGAVYYYRSLVLTAEMAERLGRTEDVKAYGKLAKQALEATLDEFFSPGGRITVDTQAAYIIALKFGVYRKKEVLIRQFLDRIKRDCFEIKCGFVGAPLLCMTLCENGMEDLAYHFLFNESFPGWLYCVNLGATTIWERWNSLLSDGTCSGTGMNSLNHYSYGAVVEFFYAYIAGIRAAEPGFRRAVIAPLPDMRFRYVNASYDSACGKYVSNWKIEKDGRFTLYVEIPFHCEAEVMLPEYHGQELTVTHGSVDAGKIGEAATITLGTGAYEFTYLPTRDYRKRYQEGTRLLDIAKDGEAMEILKEELPAAYDMILSQDKEALNRTFGELKYMFFAGFNPEIVGKATDRIFRLIRW